MYIDLLEEPPEKGFSIRDYIAGLDGKGRMEAMQHASEEKVFATIPKFTFSFDTLLNESLQTLGMTDSFSLDRADFSGMAAYRNENIYISKVIHKTKITVDEKGTKAGAVTEPAVRQAQQITIYLSWFIRG